jgi:hypothetical protein
VTRAISEAKRGAKTKRQNCGRIEILIVDDGILPLSNKFGRSEEPRTVLNDAVIPDITTNQM